MSINLTLPSPSSSSYSLDMIRQEVSHLLEKGIISRQQPIYVLCQYIPAREWVEVENELAQNDYLLRDRIGDLISTQSWQND